ncbi:MAG: hypothetical protein H6834_11355 [Planctomycetes bacterium]|nr:hypothetical protein [Planctomycetota bacterium]
MNCKWIQRPQGALRSWIPLVEQWGQFLLHYEQGEKTQEGVVKDHGYWNGEAANVGFLAASAFAVGGASLVEPGVARTDGKDETKGKADLYLRLPNESSPDGWNRFLVEAKAGWVSPRMTVEQCDRMGEGAIDQLETLKGTVVSPHDDDPIRVAAVFAVLSLPNETTSYDDEAKRIDTAFRSAESASWDLIARVPDPVPPQDSRPAQDDEVMRRFPFVCLLAKAVL